MSELSQSPLASNMAVSGRYSISVTPTKDPNSFKIVNSETNETAFRLEATHTGKFLTIESFGDIAVFGPPDSLLWNIIRTENHDFQLKNLKGEECPLTFHEYFKGHKYKFIAPDGDSFAWQDDGDKGHLKCIIYPSKKTVAVLRRGGSTMFSEHHLEVSPSAFSNADLISVALFITLWRKCVESMFN